MARPLRIEFSGAVYFIVSKGNASQKIFLGSGDATSWLEVFKNVCKRFGWICYSYCLMSDRYMIVIETPKPNLSKGMRQLNGIYTQSFNRRHGRDGHVFRGRYGSVLVQKSKYLADLIKYVLFSPVRSGFVKLPHQFKWSSCKYMLNKEECPDWFDKNYVNGLFDDLSTEFSEKADLKEDILNQITKQVFLGDEKFINDVQGYIDKEKDITEIPKIQRSALIQQYLNSSDSREIAIARTYLSGDYTLRQLADHFSLHYSTVSRIVKDHEQGLL